ncbi:MAG: ABC transporter permease [Sedimentisphaerales bacterium]|nr:ABC transporter permease [Sedimentisphaerales bacterium]
MFLFRLKRTLKLGIKSLWMHRLRSTLTALGIIFGVSSVIAMLAIGEGASADAQRKIAQLGSHNIIIETQDPPEEKSSTGQQQTLKEYGLTYNDAERFRNAIPDVQVIVPNRRIPQEAQYRTNRASIEVVGTVPWYPQISTLQVQYGRFVSALDMRYKRGVCVIDDQIVKALFAFDYPIGEDIKLGTDYYRVVGVAKEKDDTPETRQTASSEATSQAGANVGTIYVPLTTAQDRFGETNLQMSGTSGITMERVELQEIVVKVNDLMQIIPAKQSVETLLKKYHKKNDYAITVPLELMKRQQDIQRIFTIVLGSIAAISLIVGGIGIMNIMLATVSERTREIGIRRALGAKKKDIIFQFLSETFILTATGGILGIILGLGIPSLVEYYGNMPTVVKISSIGWAFGISSAVGIIFGLYPAYRAANMDPIESLRHE